MKLSLIANPSAGGGRTGRALNGVEQTLSRLGLEHHTELTRSLEHARELAADAAAAGEVAVAFGGDGLIGAVAGSLRHTDGVLGVLPGGRGNDFARALGIPLDPVAACEVLARGAEAMAKDDGQLRTDARLLLNDFHFRRPKPRRDVHHVCAWGGLFPAAALGRKGNRP